MSSPSNHLDFDPTPEIFATDNSGTFFFALQADGKSRLATSAYDEVRFTFSLWHPSGQRTIDLDRAYVELRASFEPVVPAYGAGDSFDGWIVLPVLAASGAFALLGAGFEPRARLQIRASAYFVA
jgi:hypothetical protein